MSRRYFPRLLTSVALPLALLMAGAAVVHAETVTVPIVPGSLDGANGADGLNPGDSGQPGGSGGSATADAGYSVPNSDPLNQASATGGNGGAGGSGRCPGTAAMAAQAAARPREQRRRLSPELPKPTRTLMAAMAAMAGSACWGYGRRGRRREFLGADVGYLRVCRSRCTILWRKWRAVRRRHRWQHRERGRRRRQHGGSERLG